MKKSIWLFMILALLLAACGQTPDEVEETPAAATETPASALEQAPEGDVFPRATLTPPPVEEPEADPETGSDAESYPAPPTTTPFPDDYPVPTLSPTLDPYPAAEGSIWIIRPVGEQCAEQDDYPDLQAAISDLITVGVEVSESETVDLPVCMACGCPTSAHFRVQIDAADLSNAELLGWTEEP